MQILEHVVYIENENILSTCYLGLSHVKTFSRGPKPPAAQMTGTAIACPSLRVT